MRINWMAAAPWLCTIGLFALWEGVVWLLEVAPYVLPPPSLIAAASWEFGDALSPSRSRSLARCCRRRKPRTRASAT